MKRGEGKGERDCWRSDLFFGWIERGGSFVFKRRGFLGSCVVVGLGGDEAAVGRWRMANGMGVWRMVFLGGLGLGYSGIAGRQRNSNGLSFKDDMDTGHTHRHRLTDQCDSLRFGMSDDRAMHGFGKMAFFEDGQAVSCGLFGMSDNRTMHFLEDRQAVA